MTKFRQLLKYSTCKRRPGVTSATVYMQKNPQSRQVWQVSLPRANHISACPLHILPDHPRALESHQDPQWSVHHHPLVNFSALGLKPATTPSLHQAPSLFSTISEHLSSASSLIPGHIWKSTDSGQASLLPPRSIPTLLTIPRISLKP